jgi:hypothetical protein
MDQCTAIAFMWEPYFDPDTITTPFPRPVDEYILGLVSEADDVPLSSVLDPSFGGTAHDSFLNLRIKALTLLSKTISLRHAPDRFSQIKASLDRLCDGLPAEFRSPWPRWDEGDALNFPRMPVTRDMAVVVSFPKSPAHT